MLARRSVEVRAEAFGNLLPWTQVGAVFVHRDIILLSCNSMNASRLPQVHSKHSTSPSIRPGHCERELCASAYCHEEALPIGLMTTDDDHAYTGARFVDVILSNPSPRSPRSQVVRDSHKAAQQNPRLVCCIHATMGFIDSPIWLQAASGELLSTCGNL